ncbi:MAG TPA: S41 family peptidase [Candidatus Angelobacter sp.]|jgi:carboxyl-terminal processing protease
MVKRLTLAGFLVLVCVAPYTTAQTPDTPLSKRDRDWLKHILWTVRDDIKKNYYDPSFNGLDLDRRFQEAERKLEAAPNRNYAMADIAGAVSALNDSHAFFLPPARPFTHDYGWRMQAEGDSDCFITAVRPGSDADKKGLKPGDQLLSVAGFSAIREDVWKIQYVYSVLRPQLGLRLIVRSPDGNMRQLDTMADIRSRPFDPWKSLFDQLAAAMKQHMPRTVEYGKNAIIYRLPDFVFNPDNANEMLDKIRGHEALVLDLRGNPGGSVEFLSRFLGGMFDHEIKIGDRVGRKPMHAQLTKSRGDKTFQGKLVVLIDSQSGSAAELFARIVQLEKRGTVVGDRSSGMVMESKLYTHEVETMAGLIHYAVSITDANMIMTDGKSLEHTGVLPDERIVPSAADLVAARDPALARAAELVGVKLTPEEAAKLFPVQWPNADE